MELLNNKGPLKIDIGHERALVFQGRELPEQNINDWRPSK